MTKTQKLKGFIVSKGLTQGKLAKAIGIDKSTLSRKINRLELFTVLEVKRITETLELSDEEARQIFLE